MRRATWSSRYGDVTGTNLSAAFHPWRYVHDHLIEGFSLKESLPAALADGAQDVHIAERVE